MSTLRINQCQSVTIKELFRVGYLGRTPSDMTLHPGDLEGLFNLTQLKLEKVDLQYQDFQQTPNLIRLELRQPVNYRHLDLGHLTKLQELSIETTNAECTLLKEGYIRQLIGGLENLQEVYLSGRLYMPSTEQGYGDLREQIREKVQDEVLSASSGPIERDNIRIEISLTDNQEYLPSCSGGH